MEKQIKWQDFLPSECPECGTSLEFDGIHLICPNTSCPGRIAKILAYGVGVLDLKGVGGERIRPFAKDFSNLYEVMVYVLDCPEKLEEYGLKPGTRLHEIFVNSFKNIKSLPYEKVIQILGYENVGKKLSIQIAKEHCGIEADYTGLERALVSKLRSPGIESYIKHAVRTLEEFGITIDKPSAPKSDSVGVVMTGSPSPINKTKKEFISNFSNITEVSITDKNCQYLITDSLSSETSKMKTAKKKNIIIITYKDFKNKFNSL